MTISTLAALIAGAATAVCAAVGFINAIKTRREEARRQERIREAEREALIRNLMDSKSESHYSQPVQVQTPVNTYPVITNPINPITTYPQPQTSYITTAYTSQPQNPYYNNYNNYHGYNQYQTQQLDLRNPDAYGYQPTPSYQGYNSCSSYGNNGYGLYGYTPTPAYSYGNSYKADVYKGEIEIGNMSKMEMRNRLINQYNNGLYTPISMYTPRAQYAYAV